MDPCTDNIQARWTCRKKFLRQPKEHRCNFTKTSPCHRTCSGWSLRLLWSLLEGSNFGYQHWTLEVKEQDTTFLLPRERLKLKQWDNDNTCSKTLCTDTSFVQCLQYVIMFIVDAKFVTIQKIHEFDIDDTKYIYSYVMF